MDYDAMLLGLVLGVLMLLFLNWVYFFNWYQLIGWIVSLLNPKLTVKEIEDERNKRRSESYKKYLQKWRIRFLLVVVAFSLVYLMICFLTQGLLAAYFSGLLAALIAYGILAKKESKARERLLLEEKLSAELTDEV